MKLAHLRHITAVAERGSLRAAARQLGIAQPAITKSIREAERELGVALFERRPRGVVLTAIGQVFLRRAATIQNELRLAIDEVAQLRGGVVGQVSASLSSAVQMAMMPRVLAPFRKRFGEVHLTVTDGTYVTTEASLLDGSLDFYVGPLAEHPPSGGLVAEKLFDHTRLVFGRKDHPKSGARSLSELVDAQWIRTLIAVDKSAEIEHVFEQHGLTTPRVDFTAASTIGVILAAAHSDLLAMLPKLWLDFAGTRELLEPIAIAEVLPASPICIVSRAHLPLTPAAEFLADLFRRVATRYSADASAD